MLDNPLIMLALGLPTFCGVVAVAYYRFYYPRRKRVDLSYLHAQFLKPVIEKPKPLRR